MKLREVFEIVAGLDSKYHKRTIFTEVRHAGARWVSGLTLSSRQWLWHGGMADIDCSVSLGHDPVRVVCEGGLQFIVACHDGHGVLSLDGIGPLFGQS